MEKTDVVIKQSVILNLIQDLQRTLLCKQKGNDNGMRGRSQIKFGMTPNLMGFTLIELLVVVLIIGILTAVAVPQYKKAVEKSRNSEMKQLVKAVADAERVYYLANGKYAGNFSELDLNLPLTPMKKNGTGMGFCSNNGGGHYISGTDAGRENDDFYIVLNSKDLENLSVVSYRKRGPYKCAGFAVRLHDTGIFNSLHCREGDSTVFAKTGAFCQKIEGATYKGKNGGYFLYSLP